jgi:hypothetical protein
MTRHVPRQRAGSPPRTAYTPREVSESIGRPYKWVLERIKSGDLKGRKVGLYWIITPAALDEFLEQAS